MTGYRRIKWFILGVLAAAPLIIGVLIVLDVLIGHKRPAGPGQDVRVGIPWGAIDLDELQADPNNGMDGTIAESIRSETPGDFDPDHDGVREYSLLALSGGGSNGAFGAGLLVGWTAAGTRPKFKIVTGVSTGALQATAAFLGSEYDYALREVYTEYETKDIYKPRSPLLVLYSDSVNVTSPLKKIIDKYITGEILTAVAEAHAKGQRLFMGTTNLDRREFVIWDMGEIASSGRADALELYRKVMLASCSIPIVFPPVYFEIEGDGETYHEMHCDGGAYAQVFFRGFLLDFEDAMIDLGMQSPNIEIDLYIINNGKSFMEKVRQNVTPRATSIAAVSINNLFKITMISSLYRMYVLAERNGIGFNIAAIPEGSDLSTHPLEFDKKCMRKLFDLGYEMAKNGYEWSNVPPALDRDEIFATE